MDIQDNSFVAIDYKLTLDSGEVVDESEKGKPLGFLFGCGQLIPGLERQMAGMGVGDTAKLTVEAAEGYGAYQDDLVRAVPKENFPDDVPLQVGMVFQGSGPHGPVAIRIKAIEDERVMADFNHPLAGERLHFEVTVAEVREATPAEIEALTHGHDHGHDCPEHGGCQGCGQH